jgi:hypothetical protein
MPVYRLAGAAVLFIHVPKCGGTSLEQMLVAHPACTAQGMYEIGPDNLLLSVGRCSPQHLHAKPLKRLLRLNQFDLIFTVIRDPLSRLLSEFAMQRGRAPSSTPADFAAWYAREQEQRRRNPFHADNHLRPAHDFVLPQALVYNFSAGLAVIWADLCRRLEMDPAASPLQHVRPCDGPRLGAAELQAEPRQRIWADYAADWALQAQLDQRLLQGFPWTDGRQLC